MNPSRFEKQMQRWAKIREKGMLFLMLRHALMGFIVGFSVQAILLFVTGNTGDIVYVAPIWGIAFGLLYFAVGWFAWHSQEKKYRKYLESRH